MLMKTKDRTGRMMALTPASAAFSPSRPSRALEVLCLAPDTARLTPYNVSSSNRRRDERD